MPNPTNPNSPIIRIGNDGSRIIWHGARALDAAGVKASATQATGQQVAVTVPTDGTTMNFQFTAGDTTSQVMVSNDDATDHDTMMQAVLGDPKYFTLTADPNLPSWVFHPRQYSCAQPKDDDKVLVTIPGSATGFTVVGLPDAAIEEVIDEVGGSFVSLCSKGTPVVPLKRELWQPAILVRFPLKLATPPTNFPAAMQLFEVTGTPQADRYFLDQLGLLPPGVANPPSIAGIALLLEHTDRGTKALVRTAPLTEWTVARANLTSQARANQNEFRAAVAPAADFQYPYIASYKSGAPNEPNYATDTISLLQMASITNSGGYFLRTPATTPADGLTLVLAVLLNQVDAPASATDSDVFDLDDSAQLPLAANAIAYSPSPTPGAALVFPDFVRFESIQHVQVTAAAPPGHILFGWTRDQLLTPPTGPTSNPDPDEFGYGTISMVAYSVTDGNNTSLKSIDDSQALSPVSPLEGQNLPSATPAAVAPEMLHHTGGGSAMRLRSAGSMKTAPALAVAATAPATVTQYFRATYPCFDSKDNPWLWVGDPKRRLITVEPGMRDIYGNSFDLKNPAPFARTLFYTDALIAPSDWPGVRFALYPSLSSAGQPQLNLEMSYHFLDLKTDKTIRLKQLSAILRQLQGVGADIAHSDVSLSLSASPLLKSKFQLNLGEVFTQLQSFQSAEKGNATASPPPLVYTPPPIPCDGTVSDCVWFDPQLLLQRTMDAYGPASYIHSELADTIVNQVMSASSRVNLQLAASSTATSQQTDSFADVAQKFQDTIAGQLQAYAAYLRDPQNQHELWLIPGAFFPQADSSAAWSFVTPRPISTSLGNDTFPGPDFTQPDAIDSSGALKLSKQLTMTDLDFDDLGRSAFQLIEDATADLNVLPLLANQNAMRALLATRQSLADLLANFGAVSALPSPYLVPIFLNDSGQPGNFDSEAIVRSTQDAFRQNLSGFYALSTIIQLPLSRQGNSKIQLFEGVVQPFSAASAATNPVFSDVLLGRHQDGTPDTKVTVLYDLPAGLDATQATKPASIQINFNYVQLPVDTTQQLPAGFNQGRWLKLASAYSILWNTPANYIPVALREYPSDPILLSAQTTLPQLPTKITASDAQHLSAWGWLISFELPDAESEDAVNIEVLYNPAPQTSKPVAFAALASPTWTPPSLIGGLYVLSQLRNNWERFDPTARLVALNSLASSLIPQLSPRTVRALAEMPTLADDFKLAVGSTSIYNDPHALSIMQTITVEQPLAIGAKSIATLVAAADGINNKASLLGGTPPPRSFRITMQRTRNETLPGWTPKVNTLLVYHGASVQSPVDYSPLNVWNAQLAFDMTGYTSLKDALSAFFSQFLLSQTLTGANIEITLWHVWQKNQQQTPDPIGIIPSGTLIAEGVPERIFSVCEKYFGPGLPPRKDVDSSSVRMRIKVTEEASAGPEPRLLVDIEAIDFALPPLLPRALVPAR